MRLAQLDAVRALAIGLVIVEHYAGKGVNAHFPIGAGSMGVGLFFALSGFLITSSLLGDADATGGTSVAYYRNFYVRRALRLLPALYLWIAILWALDIAPIRDSWVWHVSYLTNFWISLGHPMLDFWSLAVEEQFYLLWPMVIALTPRRYLLHVILLSTLVAPMLFRFLWVHGGEDPGLIKTLLITNVTELGFGSVLGAVCYRGGKSYDFSWYTPKLHRIFSAITAVSLVECALFWALSGKQGPFRFYFNDGICAISFVWLILNAGIGFTGPARFFFNNRFVQYIGTISYGIYLVHHFMPPILVKLFGPMPRAELGILSLSTTLLLTSLSWRYFERPILKLKRFFEPSGKGVDSAARNQDATGEGGPSRTSATMTSGQQLSSAHMSLP